jgi:hypothetical protein
MQPTHESAERLGSVVRYVVTHPWQTFVVRWNWKAALLSAACRGMAFALPMARLAGMEAGRSLCIEVGFRIAIGGFWGSLLQPFRRVQPAWLAGFSVAVVLPATAQVLEFAALRAGHATHIRAGMVVSAAISAGSLLINLGLMRRGLLITGAGGESLASDLRRVPGALAAILRGRSRGSLI